MDHERERQELLTMKVIAETLKATKQLKASHPNVKEIILTGFSDQDHVLPAIRAGAVDDQLKDVEPDELAKTIHVFYQRERWLPS